ncbi:Uma2 family endonuclease [Yinghuangia sp. YIM S10712]|uniref:Uma2 family endonuclease n=1 Tax=Yinghuangia sp. YIM S10712 TaxID=3436930 RepID=UPI003F5291AB
MRCAPPKATRKADIHEKPAEYAASDVPVYLIVDRKVPEVVVHHGPTGHGYAHTDRYPVGKDVALPGPIDMTLDMTFLPDYLD